MVRIDGDMPRAKPARVAGSGAGLCLACGKTGTPSAGRAGFGRGHRPGAEMCVPPVPPCGRCALAGAGAVPSWRLRERPLRNPGRRPGGERRRLSGSARNAKPPLRRITGMFASVGRRACFSARCQAAAPCAAFRRPSRGHSDNCRFFGYLPGTCQNPVGAGNGGAYGVSVFAQGLKTSERALR